MLINYLLAQMYKRPEEFASVFTSFFKEKLLA